MQGQRIVDAAAVCQELDALCVNLELRHRGMVQPTDTADRTHARCVWQLLGSEPDKIVSASGRYVTTKYLRELWHELPWSIEIQFGEHLVTPAWETPEPEQVAMLRRWMERMQTAERPARRYTSDKIPKGLIIASLKINDDKFQRMVKADPGLVHPQHNSRDREICFDEDALINTEIYAPSQRAAAIAEWKRQKTKASNS